MTLGLRHYTRRKKARQQGVLEHLTFSQALLDTLIYPAAVLAPLALVPQAWELYSTHDARGLSLVTWLTLGLLNVLWLAYGYVHREKPVFLTNAMLMVLNLGIALGILIFR